MQSHPPKRALITAGLLLSALVLLALYWSQERWPQWGGAYVVVGLVGVFEGCLLLERSIVRLSTALLASTLFQLLQPQLGGLLLILESSEGEPLLSEVVAGVLSYGAAALLLLPWVGFYLRGRPLFRSELRRRWLLAVGIGVLYGAAGVASLALWSAFFPGVSAALTLSDETVWLVALTLLLAPLWEELLFRGLLFRALFEHAKERVWLSLPLSAVLFTAVHTGHALTPLFMVGLFCSLAYWQTGSLLAPVLAHFLYNLASWFA